MRAILLASLCLLLSPRLAEARGHGFSGGGSSHITTNCQPAYGFTGVTGVNCDSVETSPNPFLTPLLAPNADAPGPTVVYVPVATPVPAGTKVCPLGGELYTADVKFCPQHGAKLRDYAAPQ